MNAEKIAVTGNKLDAKMYYRHSGYPGGLKQRTLREQLERRPTEVLRKAVKGMLPQNKLAQPADHEAEDLRRPRASARGAGAEALLMSTTLLSSPPSARSTSAPASARPRSRA